MINYFKRSTNPNTNVLRFCMQCPKTLITTCERDLTLWYHNICTANSQVHNLMLVIWKEIYCAELFTPFKNHDPKIICSNCPTLMRDNEC